MKFDYWTALEFYSGDREGRGLGGDYHEFGLVSESVFGQCTKEVDALKREKLKKQLPEKSR